MPVCSYMSKAIKWCRPTVLIAPKPMIAMIGKPMISDFFFSLTKKQKKKKKDVMFCEQDPHTRQAPIGTLVSM